MNKISAEILADSLNETGQRITTFLVVFPRIVLAEFNTHRMLTRNSASSRATPFERMLNRLATEPFIPIKFQKEHSGMQGSEYFEGSELSEVEAIWISAKESMILHSKLLSEKKVTKQLCNRLLEPFMYHTVIVTATDWENFFSLRAHEAAEIHIADLAYKMLVSYNEYEPKKLKAGEWHIPFGNKMDMERIHKLVVNKPVISNEVITDIKIKIATARCARVSYLNYEGNDDYEADIKLHDKLSELGHWSPFEHCARSMTDIEIGNNFTINDFGNEYGTSGNFRGFVQYRKTFEGENATDIRVLKK